MWYCYCILQIVLKYTKRKSHSPWILSSYNSDVDTNYPDSLDRAESVPPVTLDTSSSHHFQTANNFLWYVGESESQFYDSIDSNLNSSLYHHNGEDLAECDSLEKQFSDTSNKK